MEQLSTIIRIILTGVGAYISIILMLRISGKRTLAKMNAFDFIVTVALGSILATTLTSQQTSLIAGLTAFGTLVALQYILAKLSKRYSTVNKLIKSEPTLLFYRGDYLHEYLKRERILEMEVVQAIRASGTPFDHVEAVVLETDGTFSVLKDSQYLMEHVKI
ncbi:DUF421 domain-containing protein [Exiguobacterium marinum]|uniref:DUF421 domain-containing protein n=1 Tax=Exiguobacterium marinum TaxID=273528 RepID=A0ABY7WZ61_9BACL|nr:YetF domain-containing protein [Exiguobacterium marinum]WDH75572.1 DUF421 domain-containing protein [Exiguobacterium marinum]